MIHKPTYFAVKTVDASPPESIREVLSSLSPEDLMDLFNKMSPEDQERIYQRVKQKLAEQEAQGGNSHPEERRQP